MAGTSEDPEAINTDKQSRKAQRKLAKAAQKAAGQSPILPAAATEQIKKKKKKKQKLAEDAADQSIAPLIPEVRQAESNGIELASDKPRSKGHKKRKISEEQDPVDVGTENSSADFETRKKKKKQEKRAASGSADVRTPI